MALFLVRSIYIRVSYEILSLTKAACPLPGHVRLPCPHVGQRVVGRLTRSCTNSKALLNYLCKLGLTNDPKLILKSKAYVGDLSFGPQR